MQSRHPLPGRTRVYRVRGRMRRSGATRWLRAAWLLVLLSLAAPGSPALAGAPEFEEVFDQHGVVMLWIEPESGEIVDANPAAASFYGYSREELRGMPIQQINTFTPEQVAEERELAALEGRNYFIFRHRLADGEIRTVEVHSHPFPFNDQTLLLSVIQDITPGRNLEQGLWHYQERLEEMVELQSAEIVARERQLRYWLIGGLVVLSVLVLALALNIRRRRHSEERLRTFSEDFHTFLDQTTDFIYFKDAQSRIRFCSQPLARITGHDDWREMVGKHDREIFPADTARIYEEEEQAIFAEGRPILNRVDPFYDADGRRGYVQTHKWPLFDALGRVRGVFGISRDITEHKLIEQTLSTLNGELARMGGEEFFQRACRLLCESLGTEIAFIGRLEEEQHRVDAFAGWADGQPLTPFRYDLTGTPCANLTKDGTACYPENIRSLFPQDHLLEEMGIEAYVGHNLIDRQGSPLGILVTLSRQPLKERLHELAPAMLGLFVDRVASEMQRSEAEDRLMQAASVFHHANEGILITDPQGRILDVNAAFSRITGYRREEVLGRNPSMLQSGKHDEAFYADLWQTLRAEGSWSGEVWNRRKDGELYAEMLTISAVRDGEGAIQRYVGLFSDITPLKEQQRQLEYMAHFDALTELPNRVLLADRLHQAMAQVARRERQLALVYLDLDRFKEINDDHGHEVGDRMLVALAERLKGCLREGDTLARLGGDEFVAVLPDLPDVESAQPLLQRLRETASRPVHDGRHHLQVTASLGVSLYPQAEPVDADQLLRQADQAMYQAKLAGGDRYHLFDVASDRNLRDQNEALEAIRQGLANDEFVLFYQPKVSMRSGELVGAEALIRWQHPEHGLRPPGAFLPQLEGHPLMVELGNRVIEMALAQIEQWREQGRPLTVSVNVDALQLSDPDFIAGLRAALARHPRAQPGDLELEVVETSALQDITHVSSLIEECRELGVRFSLDDFGTGYSSLSYLKRLPVETLKIDQSFVRDMLYDPDDLSILHGIIGLAGSFQREVLAEGVETELHGEMLLQLGCEMAQGYAIARPMPADQLLSWQAQWQPHASWTQATPVANELRPMLFGIVTHQAWVSSLQEFLQDRAAQPPEPDPRRCPFGRWLHAHDPDGDRMPSIHALHDQVHQLGDELVRLKNGGQAARALARFGEMEALSHQMTGAIRGLIGARASRPEE
ncbi:EAL domain-containing protein [Thioalkalivibrio sp. AKL17]|uniref:EAL domain-containing protein n=1 Tax=Thioalkalivibrio sp. AKL17 TaxID=1158160 RepID=UPI00035ED29C